MQGASPCICEGRDLQYPSTSRTYGNNENDVLWMSRAQIKDSFIRILLGRRAYGFLFLIIAPLFLLHHYILDPSNFASFSDTSRYFISALSTLLAVVVSFNTLALRNQLNNMPTDMQSLNSQLEKMTDLLQPASEGYARGFDNNKPHLYYADTIVTLLKTAEKHAVSLIQLHDQRKAKGGNGEPLQRDIYVDFSKEITNKLTLYAKHNNSFFLVSLSTTPFLEKMKFESSDFDGKQTKELFETAKRLHIVRNIGIRIFIRNALTRLSFDMLVFTIPIIAFAAIISAISNYESYNTMLLRILFAASISTVVLPFILLFIRTLPVLQLIRGSSSIPFAEEKQ